MLKIKLCLKTFIPKLPDFIQDGFYYVYFYLRYKKKFITNSNIYLSALNGKRGIEIGGPSFIFRSILPVYSVIQELDGVNYSNLTKWEGSISEGKTYRWYGAQVGKQYISECTDLGALDSASYEFLISSNCLEHTSNPLKALKEWLRVIRPRGLILLVLPKKDSNFDNKRPVTKFSHLISDEIQNMGEDDLTHLDEVLALHDLSKDINAGSYKVFQDTCRANLFNREMHHHVFDINLVLQIFSYLGVKMIQIDTTKFENIFLGEVP